MRVGIARSLGTFVARYRAVALDDVLREARVSPAQLADPDGLLAMPHAFAILEAGARLTGDRAFGLSYMAQLPWRDLGVLGYVLLHSPTVGAAFANLVRYLGLQQSAGGITVEVGATETRIVRQIAPSNAASAQGAEAAIALYTHLVRDGTGRADWRPRAVHFRHRAPRPATTQREYFACPIRYGERCDELVLASADLRIPFRTADDALLPILLRHADSVLAAAPARDALDTEVRRLVLAAVGSGDVTVEQIGAQLGLAPRSFQRRLREQGLSFQDIVSDARLALAQRYLADASLSLTQAAFLLGYSDLSAFSRAFRRWTGQSAQAYRRAKLGAAR